MWEAVIGLSVTMVFGLVGGIVVALKKQFKRAIDALVNKSGGHRLGSGAVPAPDATPTPDANPGPDATPAPDAHQGPEVAIVQGTPREEEASRGTNPFL